MRIAADGILDDGTGVRYGFSWEELASFLADLSDPKIGEVLKFSDVRGKAFRVNMQVCANMISEAAKALPQEESGETFDSI